LLLLLLKELLLKQLLLRQEGLLWPLHGGQRRWGLKGGQESGRVGSPAASREHVGLEGEAGVVGVDGGLDDLLRPHIAHVSLAVREQQHRRHLVLLLPVPSTHLVDPLYEAAAPVGRAGHDDGLDRGDGRRLALRRHGPQGEMVRDDVVVGHYAQTIVASQVRDDELDGGLGHLEPLARH
jgi:hypothetical protein